MYTELGNSAGIGSTISREFVLSANSASLSGNPLMRDHVYSTYGYKGFKVRRV